MQAEFRSGHRRLMEALAEAEVHEALRAAAPCPALPIKATVDAPPKGSFAALDSFLRGRGPAGAPVAVSVADGEPGGSCLPLPAPAAAAGHHGEWGTAQAAVPAEAHCASAAAADAAAQDKLDFPARGVAAVEQGGGTGPAGGATSTAGCAMATSAGKRPAGSGTRVLRRPAAGPEGGGKRLKQLSMQDSQTEYVRITTAVKARDPGELHICHRVIGALLCAVQEDVRKETRELGIELGWAQ